MPGLVPGGPPMRGRSPVHAAVSPSCTRIGPGPPSETTTVGVLRLLGSHRAAATWLGWCSGSACTCCGLGGCAGRL